MEWLNGIVGVVLATLITTWLLGFLNRFVPSPGRLFLAVTNTLRAKSRRSEDRFCFVLCWLENDSNGDDTGIVAQAFSSVQGVTLVRSARIVKDSGAADDWRPAMQRNAREVLEGWRADLAVVGLVKKSREVLSLWFVPRLGEGTLGRGDQPYQLEDVALGADFHDDLCSQLTAVALAAAAPLAKTETRGRVLEEGLREATNRLATLLGGSTIDEPKQRADLLAALGTALLTMGERESEAAHLEQAVEAYRAALDEQTRERVPLSWAATQNNLGSALQKLGARESGTARLEQAVEVYRAALEEYTRERVPLNWATTQTNLGNTFLELGARESGTARLEQAVEAYRAALEERTRERVPLVWAATQNNLGSALQELGKRESGTVHLEQAVEAYHAALQELTAEVVPWFHDITKNNLTWVLQRLRERGAEPGSAGDPD